MESFLYQMIPLGFMIFVAIYAQVVIRIMNWRPQKQNENNESHHSSEMDPELLKQSLEQQLNKIKSEIEESGALVLFLPLLIYAGSVTILFFSKGSTQVTLVINFIGFFAVAHYYAVKLAKLKIKRSELTSKVTTLERETQELRAQQEQHKRLEYLSFMATAVAHNINNPLQSIRGSSDYLLDFFNEVSPAEIQENLRRITANTERLAKIVKTFREYARGDREKREPLNLNEVVKETTDLFQAQFKHHKIRLHLDFSPQMPYLNSNSFSLQEILLILLSNAREAVTGREQATIWVSTWTTDNEVGFQVADNGPGIPADQQSRLFMPFNSQKPQGTGLGLYISHQLLNTLAGNIRYDNRPGGGACFRVSLPITRG